MAIEAPATAGAVTGTAETPVSTPPVSTPEAVVEAPNGDPYEGKSAAEIREYFRAHPNSEVREAFKREGQSEADRILSAKQKETEQSTQLARTIEQVRGMAPDEFHRAVLEQLDVTAKQRNVDSETLRTAQMHVLNTQVTEAIADLGNMSPEEKELTDPNKHESYASWRKGYTKIVEQRAVARERAKLQKEEGEAARAEAKAKVRNDAPTQDLGQDRTSRPSEVDLSDLKGTGNILEALRRQRLAKSGNWPTTQ